MSELIKLIKKSTKTTSLDFKDLLKNLVDTLTTKKSALSSHEIDSASELFLKNKQYETLGNFLTKLNELEVSFNHAHIVNLLLMTKNLDDNLNIEKLLKKISREQSMCFLRQKTKNNFLNKFIEKNRLRTFEKQALRKNELLEKFEFFRTQHLEDKAKETLEELILSFPDEPSLGKYISNEKEKNYEKVLVRTAKKSLRSNAETIDKRLFDQDALKMRHVWFKLWKDSFVGNETLLKEQMSFLNYEEDEEIAHELLKSSDLDVWERVELLHRVKRFYEGLELLDKIEDEVLAKKPEMVYNFYYYKALMLKGAGLDKEALSIIEAIIEQNASFRDVKYLFKKWQ